MSDLIHITGESSRHKGNLDAWNNSNRKEGNELRSEDTNHTLVSVMMSPDIDSTRPVANQLVVKCV